MSLNEDELNELSSFLLASGIDQNSFVSKEKEIKHKIAQILKSNRIKQSKGKVKRKKWDKPGDKSTLPFAMARPSIESNVFKGPEDVEFDIQNSRNLTDLHEIVSMQE